MYRRACRDDHKLHDSDVEPPLGAWRIRSVILISSPPLSSSSSHLPTGLCIKFIESVELKGNSINAAGLI